MTWFIFAGDMLVMAFMAALAVWVLWGGSSEAVDEAARIPCRTNWTPRRTIPPMAELPSTFWSGWVAVITVASLIGLFWLIYGVYFAKGSREAG